MKNEEGETMNTMAYWRQRIAVAFVVMAVGYWLMTAFTFTIPVWLVVLASTLGVLVFVEWVSGRLPSEDLELSVLIRPVGVAMLTLAVYGLLTRFNFLPSSALLLSVLVSTSLLDLVLDQILGRAEEAPLPVRA
jgi:hypothetical protein